MTVKYIVKYIYTFITKYRPVNQLLCDKICSTRLLMINYESQGDLQLIFQFSVNLKWEHIHTVHAGQTLANNLSIMSTFILNDMTPSISHALTLWTMSCGSLERIRSGYPKWAIMSATCFATCEGRHICIGTASTHLE